MVHYPEMTGDPEKHYYLLTKSSRVEKSERFTAVVLSNTNRLSWSALEWSHDTSSDFHTRCFQESCTSLFSQRRHVSLLKLELLRLTMWQCVPPPYALSGMSGMKNECRWWMVPLAVRVGFYTHTWQTWQTWEGHLYSMMIKIYQVGINPFIWCDAVAMIKHW